jgi:glutamyl-tRNA reductase
MQSLMNNNREFNPQTSLSNKGKSQLRIHCLGLSHQTAEVSIREQLVLNQEEILAYWKKISSKGEASEIVFLSTCNRVEIYAVSDHAIFEILEKNLKEMVSFQNSINHSFYKLVDEQVVSHLFRVASGLDSMVLGEPQILGQVSDSYELGLELGSSGKVLSKLFQMAIHTGKRVRTETDICKNSSSVSSLAAQIASQKVKDIIKAKIVFLGAGEMAELAVESLRKRGAKNFSVISRTISSACGLAKKWDGDAGTMDSLDGALEDADILITSTSAPHTLILKPMMELVMNQRPNRPMVIIDIAVPRDVDPDVNTLANVFVYDIDGLNKIVNEGMDNRSQEVPKVEIILKEEYLSFKEFLSSLKVVPVITEIRQQADSIRKSELEKALRRMPDLDPSQQEQISALSHSIVQKMLHTPTIRLRKEAKGPEAEQYATAARQLFGLSDSIQENDTKAD